MVHGVAVLLWFYAMTRIPIAEVTALSSSAPIFVTIGASLFLGEAIRLRRITGVLLGFIGVLIILRPGLQAIDLGAIAMLIAAPLFAISKIATKALSDTETAPTIVAYLSMVATATMLVPALWVWQTQSLKEFFWLAFTAGLATLSHLAMIRAVRLAELTVLQPVEYLNLVWAALMGLYFFAEVPSLWMWAGGAVIVGSASYIARREAKLRITAAPPDRPA